MVLDFNKILNLSGFPVEEAKSIFNAVLEKDKTAWQDEKRKEIFNFHYQNNEFYRNLVKKEITEWNDVPVIRRNDLKGDFLSKIPKVINSKKLYISNTSGSSGSPLFFARDPLTHALVWENVLYCYNQAGLSLEDKQARMFGMSRKKLDKAKARLKDWLSYRYRFDIFDLSDKALNSWVEHFKRGNFKFIYGYSNTLVVFAHYLINNNIILKTIAPKLKCCIVTSEVCTDIDAEILKKGFGIPIYNEYGSAELGIIGFKKTDHRYASDELLYLEVLDKNDNILPDGEIGILTCTSLFNKATPFIRYQLGDLASIRRFDGKTEILKVAGSLNDLAILPSGKKVPGIAFYFVAQELVESSHNVKEFLFRQTPEGFNFEYVADKAIADDDLNKIKKAIILFLKEDINISAVKSEKLLRGKNGKFKHFISSI